MDESSAHPPARIVSVNVGRPRTVPFRGRTVATAIHKHPVEGPVAVRRLNLEGDSQADLTVHGGASKAVYAYALEHYAFWRRGLGLDLPPGGFGENLTVEGLPLEDGIALGDRLRVGSAVLVVTQPRVPCYKLALHLDRDDIAEHLFTTGRTGYYLAVEREGHLTAGDPIELEPAAGLRVPVHEVIRVFARDRDDLEAAARLAALPALPEDWRRYFARRVDAAATA